EALEAIFDNMQFSLFRGTAAIMVQGLAGEDQIPLLLSKLTGEFMELEEICAAELFRINKPGLEADIKKALGAVMLPDTRVWLNAYLARYGDADALKEVQLDLTSKLPYVRQQAQVALLTLGYGTPYK